MYLCVIQDLCGRRGVGWSFSKSLGTDMVLEALRMAVIRQNPARGLLFHSDRGVQYASKKFRKVLSVQGFVQSMSRRGNCWDNACAESFF
jgi:transposase InsO family protein